MRLLKSSRKLRRRALRRWRLTDHDAIAGVAEAAEAAEELGVELVPAIEMSCVHEYAEDLHVCGYWIDLGAIAPACERAQQERVNRAGEIVEKLRGEGFELTWRTRSRRQGTRSRSGGRTSPAPPARRGDLGPFFEQYLVPGAKAFVPRRWPTAEQAVQVIKEAGGVAVVAHPYWDISDPAEVEELIRALDVDGVETFYPDPQQGADRAPAEALRRARPDPHGLLRLPRPDPQDLRRVRRLRHLRPRRAPGPAAALTPLSDGDGACA